MNATPANGYLTVSAANHIPDLRAKPDLFRTKQIDSVSSSAPTTQQFAAYQMMFDHFNRELFGGQLPHVLLNFSRDCKRAVGYYAPGRWRNEKNKLDEITLNPDHLKLGAKEVAQTLVHEMVHLWQQWFGEPSRTGYHNAQWARKMEEVGLIPSSTGAPGGKRVGQRISDYPQPGGRFEKSLAELKETLPWTTGWSAGRAARKNEKTKQKYTCPKCRTNVWGKPFLRIECVGCEVRFVDAT